MLAKANRLTKDKEFDKAFRRGRSSYDQLSGVKMIKNDLPLNRFGIIVGRRVSKKACDRNKIKRQIRAIIRKKLNVIKPHHDLLLIISSEALDKPFNELEKSVIFNLKKLKLL